MRMDASEAPLKQARQRAAPLGGRGECPCQLLSDMERDCSVCRKMALNSNFPDNMIITLIESIC